MALMARFYRLALAMAAMAAAPAPAQVKTYALVAAMGSRFEVVYEIESVGSHLPPFRREAYAVGENTLNRLALQGLDQAIARVDPDSRRIYLSTDPGRKGIGHVVAELRKLDRAAWDRILVALPAHRTQAKDGLPPRIQGLGLFGQPLCQSDTSFRDNRIGSCSHGFRPPSGPLALTPGGEEIAANSFAAPFSFVEVWSLDPKTLEVGARSVSYGHRKLTDETAKIDGVINGHNKDFLAGQIVQTVQSAIAEATYQTLTGKVEVREMGPVK
jgi:hypothetical protein